MRYVKNCGVKIVNKFIQKLCKLLTLFVYLYFKFNQMKENVFKQYVERVTNLFGITLKDFYSKTKTRDFADARYLVYYLCLERNIRVMTIKKLMQQNGCDVNHQTISHGIKSVKEKIEQDKDYRTIIKEIHSAVFI